MMLEEAEDLSPYIVNSLNKIDSFSPGITWEFFLLVDIVICYRILI